MKKRNIILFLVVFLIIMLPFVAASGVFFAKIKNFFNSGISGNSIEGCEDSDGLDIMVKGTVTDVFGEVGVDACEIVASDNSFKVYERYCDRFGGLATTSEICEYGCVDGRCMGFDERYVFNKCLDDDVGVNIVSNGEFGYSGVWNEIYSKEPSHQNDYETDSKWVKGTTQGYALTTGYVNGEFVGEVSENIQTFEDSCQGSKNLKEYKCSFYYYASPRFDVPIDVYATGYGLEFCPHGCENGACVEYKNYYSCIKEGIISTSTYDKYYREDILEDNVFYDSKTDYCLDSSRAVKYSCYPETYVPAAGKINEGEIVFCQYGCFEGVCLGQGEEDFSELIGGYTPWYNKDSPVLDGSDMEYHSGWDILPGECEIVGIECQTVDGIDYRQTGEINSCDTRWGLYCKNYQQSDGVCDYDYRVRYLCADNTVRVFKHNNKYYKLVNGEITGDGTTGFDVWTEQKNLEMKCGFDYDSITLYKIEDISLGVSGDKLIKNIQTYECITSNTGDEGEDGTIENIEEVIETVTMPFEKESVFPVEDENGYLEKDTSIENSLEGDVQEKIVTKAEDSEEDEDLVITSEQDSSISDAATGSGKSNIKSDGKTLSDKENLDEVDLEREDKGFYSFRYRVVEFFQRVFSRN